MTRKAISLSEKLASTLLALMESRGIEYDRERFKKMAPAVAAKVIISAWDFDHYPVAVALGGSNNPVNVVPRLRAEHRLKTAKTDIPAIAKVARLSKEHEAFRARMLAMREDAPQTPKSKLQSRGFPSKEARRALKQAIAKTKEKQSC